MSKDKVLMDRLGTMLLYSIVPSFTKFVITSIIIYFGIRKHASIFFPGVYECLLYSIAVYTSDSLNIIRKLNEIGFKKREIVFI